MARCAARRLARFAGAVCLALAGLGSSVALASDGLPPDASVGGARVDALLAHADWVDVWLVVFMLGSLAWVCLRYGKRHRASSNAGNGRKSKLLVMGLALVWFGVVDGTLLGGSLKADDAFISAAHADEAPTAPGQPKPLRVEVNAQQWSWEIRYAGPDGKFNTSDDPVLLDDMRLPLGRKVVVELGATDVIHSFSVPDFRVKMDAIPGQLTRVGFTGKKRGKYEIVCQQLCGVSHYKMRGILTVMPPREFRQWLVEASRHSARAYDPKDVGAHWGWAWRTRR